MNRERALKVMLVIVGLIFSAFTIPVWEALRHPNEGEATLPMMLSVYVTLGIFALLAAGNPAANRSLIAFIAWSSLAHAGVMVVQTFTMAGGHSHLLAGVALFAAIGVLLLLITPRQTSPAGVQV
jgi:hypothetical protein